jgi:hypothetical protein
MDVHCAIVCRHVVLPTDIAKMLPKNRLLSEVRDFFEIVLPTLLALAALIHVRTNEDESYGGR